MMFSRLTHGSLLGFLLLVCSLVREAAAQTNDLSGQTADSIRKVITIVANHQLHSLADGNYAPVYTLTAATNAAKPIGIEWDYPWGVDLYGLLQVSRATGDTNIENFVLDHNLIIGRYYAWLIDLKSTVTNANGTPANPAGFYSTTALNEFFTLDVPGSGKLDYCGSMTAQLLEGALHHASGPTPEQIRVATNTANYISNVQGRYSDGTLYRPERNYTIWADDLYMSCPFLIRWYLQTGDTNYLNDAVKQVINMAGYLQDTNGIWYHGFYTTSNKVNGIKWGRANGWAMVTQTELLSLMPTNHPQWTNILDILRRHIEGIKSVQQPSGMWRQVLDYDNPSNWEETSCSAMYSYCIARAVNRGWIDPTNMAVAHKGFMGVCRNLTAAGVINGTCQGTSLDTRLSYYLGLSRPSDDMHGRGAVMLAGSEILLSTNAFPPPALSVSANSNSALISWPGALSGYALETTTNFLDWAVFPGSPVATNGQYVATDPVSDARFYRLRSPFSPDFEAELLSYPAYVTNGATNVVTSDAAASGGLWISFNATNVGHSIGFALPRIPAGTYSLKLRYKASTNRGQHSLSVDGTALGGTLDQYRSSSAYLTNTFGTIIFGTPGSHVVRLTVTGRNASSTAYTLSADKLALVPQ